MLQAQKAGELDPGILSGFLLPVIPHRILKPFYPSQDTGPPISAEVNITDLVNESTRQYVERRALRKRRQATPDAITELGLSEEQHRNLKARVNRRFLVGYDRSKPMDVKPISSFIHDPCEPAGDNNKEMYEIQPVTQFQIVQYETRRKFLGTRCEKYVSQFTYYCINANHASPLPQETFYRHPKVLAQNECRALKMGQYCAGDGKTYSIARNVQKEINYFARGSANAYSGFHGSQITCTGGKLTVNGLEIDNMVMYVTEELLYPEEKFISMEGWRQNYCSLQ